MNISRPSSVNPSDGQLNSDYDEKSEILADAIDCPTRPTSKLEVGHQKIQFFQAADLPVLPFCLAREKKPTYWMRRKFQKVGLEVGQVGQVGHAQQ